MKKILYYFLFLPIFLSAQINESDTLNLKANLSLTGFYQGGNVETLIFRAKSDLSFNGFSTPISGLASARMLLPINGTAVSPSIPPRNITTTKFFLVRVELNAFEIIGAVTIKDAEPLKKTRREIFILLKPSYYIM